MSNTVTCYACGAVVTPDRRPATSAGLVESWCPRCKVLLRSERQFTPREVNDMAARLHYLACGVCGKDIGTVWAGRESGGPFILSSPDWDKPGIWLRCQKHIEKEATR